MKKNISNETINIGNSFIYVFIIYVLFVVATEWINFIFYIVNERNLSFGIAEHFSFILIALICWFKRSDFEIDKITLNRELLIGIVAILVLGILKSVYPDSGFDTFNYHLIAQNPKYKNFFVDDLGYGNFQVWGFRLGDRLFYYFRYLLGYRLGTFLNTLVFVISFTQIYELLDILYVNICNKGFLRKLICNKLLWALAILFSFDSLMMYGSYYVDAIAMPIGLETIRLLIKDCNIKISTRKIIYFALLNGLLIGLKLTNVVYVIPCVAIYSFMHIKDFKINDWIMAVLTGLFPFAEYIVFNWICTGNPVFPYYNSIFKSPYFIAVNWKDERWGGTTLIEKFLWIWSLAFKPDYRKSEIWDEWNGVLIIGLIGTLIIIAYNIVRKQAICKQYFTLVLVAITSAWLWSFTTGISRYYMIGRVFWGLLAYYFVVKAADNIKYVRKIVATLCLCIAVSNTALNMAANLSGRNWSWNKWSWKTFKEQICLTFLDNDIKNSYTHKADLFAITSHMSMGVAELIDDNIYSINMNYLDTISSFEDIRSIVEAKINAADITYDFHERALGNIHEYIEQLNNSYLYVTNMESIDLSIGTYEMISVENLNERKNTVWTSDKGALVVDISDMQGQRYLKFIGGRIYDWPAEKIKLVITISDGKTERHAAVVYLDNSTIDAYNIPLNLSVQDNLLKIIPYYESSNEIVETSQIDCAFCINVVIE